MIVAGFGFRREATLASLRDALAKAGRAQAIATVTEKAVTEVFRAFAEETNLPVTQVSPDKLPEKETATHSHHSENRYRTGSVAEAVALAAAGPGARLIAPRVVSSDRMATCALAETNSRGDMS
ncbi:cobalamin biosynthesis protein [Thetidibacter halocola]|uniref:Cobalamin biosynthesis protein n=1 Tax=Thetidibacter halocola TaxID=2827239 RepID=A0A8J7WE11_9RHOB|nr:cobalamin biosynthesis protein [Thetidibacter halocola]MBS0123981.1 cobalamin biosynthesis protein [Thetidibacter halocola]